MVIYEAKFPNGKSYIGQTTTSLSVRSRAHRYNAITQNRKGAFYDAIRKYGFDVIKWLIIAECSTWAELQIAEKELIAKNNTIVPNGYNVTEGGRQPRMTNDIRRRISLSRIGKRRGPMSAEQKAKIGDASKRVWASEGFRERYVGSGRSKRPNRKVSQGWRLTEETRKRMSASAKKSGTGKWMRRVWDERKLSNSK